MVKKRASSSDVARAAGVSRATVSAVINNTRPVSEKLTRHVRQVMHELDYQPNALARSLKLKRTHALGLIAASLSSPYWAQVISTIQKTAFTSGFHVLLSHTDEDPEKEVAHLRMMIGQHVDGVVLATCGKLDPEYILRLIGDVPVILFDRRLPAESLDSVATDNVLGSYLAIKHLIDVVGIRHIGCLGIGAESSTGSERIAGFHKALLESGIEPDAAWVKIGGYSEESGYQDALSLLEMPDRPRAVLATSHLKAVGVLRAAAQLGLSVPDDVALIGWDDMPWAAFLSPPLTVVVQPVEEMAAFATEKLIKLIRRRFEPEQDGEHERVEQILFRPKLIVRRSCGYRDS